MREVSPEPSTPEDDARALERIANTQAEQLRALRLEVAANLERERVLREQLLQAAERLLLRDVEIAGASGIALPTTRRRPPPRGEPLSRLQQLLRRLAPGEGIVLVASAGDEQLRQDAGHAAWHFPCSEEGAFLNYSPADGPETIALLESARLRGAVVLVIPPTSRAWFEGYPELRRYLEQRYRTAVRRSDIGTIYSLTER